MVYCIWCCYARCPHKNGQAIVQRGNNMHERKQPANYATSVVQKQKKRQLRQHCAKPSAWALVRAAEHSTHLDSSSLAGHQLSDNCSDILQAARDRQLGGGEPCKKNFNNCLRELDCRYSANGITRHESSGTTKYRSTPGNGCVIELCHPLVIDCRCTVGRVRGAGAARPGTLHPATSSTATTSAPGGCSDCSCAWSDDGATCVMARCCLHRRPPPGLPLHGAVIR